jgi:co-chaperonin GroES (HSP10)
MQALNFHIVIDPIKKKDHTVAGGLQLSQELDKELRYLTGRVVSVGGRVTKEMEGEPVQINVGDNVTALRTREESDGTLHKEWQFTHNVVTATGDIYYANKIAGKKADGAAYVDAGAAGAGAAAAREGATTVGLKQ